MALREARRDEVRYILDMLVDDDLAKDREDFSRGMDSYLSAFDTIAADPNNFLYVWEQDGRIAGTLQLTFIPGLSYNGSWLAQVESVRVDRALRGQRIGEKMMQSAMDIARMRGCRSMQLKTDKRRVAAHRFYERLDFLKTHEAFTIKL